jgi:hypothetical protein
MSSRNGRYCAALGGLTVLLLAGSGAAQSVGQSKQRDAEQQGVKPPQYERHTGVALACAPSADGRNYTCYRDRPGEPPTIPERLGRWSFRLWRDPIAVLTLALFTIGGWQVEISRRTAKRQLRAYVALRDYRLHDGATMDPPQPHNVNRPGIIIQVANTGATPGYEVVHHARIEVRPLSEEKLLVTPETVNASKSYLPQNGLLTKTLELGRQLAPEELAGIRNRTHDIYIMGRVDYRDAFRRKRFTTYRVRYNGAYPPPREGQLVIYCDEGNDAN